MVVKKYNNYETSHIKKVVKAMEKKVLKAIKKGSYKPLTEPTASGND